MKYIKDMKNWKLYGMCIGGMTLLVVIALFLPQIIFGTWDKFQMKNTEAEKRSGMDISQINSAYEQQMYDRMSNLAMLDIETATVAAINFEMNNEEEQELLLETIFSKVWMSRFNEITMWVYYRELTEAFVEVLDCKKYVVYGENYQDGVALMLWYLDLYVEECNMRIRLLVDSETESIYYIKLNSYYEQTDAIYSGIKQEVTYRSEYYAELLQGFVDGIPYHTDFFNDYYESETNNGLDYEADSYGYDNWNTQVVTDKIEGSCTGTYMLSYGGKNMEFLFRAQYGEGTKPDVEMGISLIANLIPEMIQN